MAHPKDKTLVIKHNALVEGRYDLTLQEKRLILWLISEVKLKDQNLNRYRVSIKDLSDFIGLDKNHVYSEMAQVTKKLMGRVISVWSDDRKQLELLHWVSYAKYDFKSGFVELRLSDELVPYLLDLKNNFTKLSLKCAVSLTSVYAVRMYELLKQYEKIGERTIEIATLREYCGIKEKQYTLYANFRMNVIDIAQREINAKTDIRFEYEPIKMSRKVHAIRFIILENDVVEPSDPIADDSMLAKMLSCLQSHGMSEAQARHYIVKYEEDSERIVFAMNELERRLKDKKEKKINNPTAWLISAIDEDFRPQQTLFETTEREKKEKAEAEKKRRKERDEKLSPFILEVRNAYKKYSRETIKEYIDNLDQDDIFHLGKRFKSFLSEKGNLAVQRFVKISSWYDEPMIKQYAIDWLLENGARFSILSKNEFAIKNFSEKLGAFGENNYEELEKEYEKISR